MSGPGAVSRARGSDNWLAVAAADVFRRWTCPGCRAWNIPPGPTAGRIDAYVRHLAGCPAYLASKGEHGTLGL